MADKGARSTISTLMITHLTARPAPAKRARATRSAMFSLTPRRGSLGERTKAR